MPEALHDPQPHAYAFGGAQRLPARDRAVLIDVIKKFVSADYVRLASLVDYEDDQVETILEEIHTDDDGYTIDGAQVRNDLEKVRELKDERDGPSWHDDD